MSGVPKFPRTFHLPFSPEIHADDKTHAEPHLFVGHEVVITEKVDGGNACLHDGLAYARSTGQPATHPTFDYIKAHIARRTVGYGDLLFYGENLYGIHSIEYTELSDFFFLFAIRHRHGEWVAWDEFIDYCNAFEFSPVPQVYRGVFDSLGQLQRYLDTMMSVPSVLGGPREGFVIRRTHAIGGDEYSRYAAKYVRAGHVQSDEHWTKNWKPAKLKVRRQAHG